MSLYVDIKKAYPDFKLAVQLDGDNEVLGLLGESGCGKSLTLKCIAGIETPDEGRIVINGETVFDSEKKINITPQERRTGYLFQNYALFPTMTVWNNIFSVIKKPKSERNDIVSDIIKKFQLESVQNLYPEQISGGQQQRVAIARILVSNPRILMLDEPFSALDTHLKWKMEQEIISVLEEFGGTTVFVSHNRDEVYRICNKLAIMNNGKIESVGTKEEIFNFPETLAAALMTGCRNISKAKKLDDFRVLAEDWGIVLKTNKRVSDDVKHVAIRAHSFEQISLHDSQKVLGEDNVFAGMIHKVIDEPFEKVFEFYLSNENPKCELKPPDTNEKSRAKLRFTIPKNVLKEEKIESLVLRVPEDKVLCLS